MLGHMPDIRYIPNCFRRKLDLVMERKETEERENLIIFFAEVEYPVLGHMPDIRITVSDRNYTSFCGA